MRAWFAAARASAIKLRPCASIFLLAACAPLTRLILAPATESILYPAIALRFAADFTAISL